jgi:hypothetical protein
MGLISNLGKAIKIKEESSINFTKEDLLLKFDAKLKTRQSLAIGKSCDFS